MRSLRCSGRRQTHPSQKPLRETSRRNGLAPLRRERQNNQSNWSNQANSTFFLSECQCSICHDWFRRDGRVRGAIFSRGLLLHRKAMSLQMRGIQTGRTGGGGKDGSEPFDVFEPEEHSDCQTEGDQDYEGKGVGKSVEAYVDIHSVEAGYKRGDHEAY